jgi:hypothetical protein
MWTRIQLITLNEDTDLASKNNVDPCIPGSATLPVSTTKKITDFWLSWLFSSTKFTKFYLIFCSVADPKPFAASGSDSYRIRIQGLLLNEVRTPNLVSHKI